MSECRSPSRAEIRKVAKRIRSETYPGQRLDPTLCRRILRVALAALDGRAGVENDRAPYRRPENWSNIIIHGQDLHIASRQRGSSTLNPE
jgi:hypothetical protein